MGQVGRTPEEERQRSEHGTHGENYSSSGTLHSYFPLGKSPVTNPLLPIIKAGGPPFIEAKLDTTTTEGAPPFAVFKGWE
jgi:hypothetical protein